MKTARRGKRETFLKKEKHLKKIINKKNENRGFEKNFPITCRTKKKEMKTKIFSEDGSI